MALLYGWIGGLFLFLGLCGFVLSFRLMMLWDVFPRDAFPEGWGLVRYGAYFGSSLSILTIGGLLGVWISHFGDKKEG